MIGPLDNPAGVEAAKRVLIEVWTVLGEYRDALTLVGGAAPPLLLGEVAGDPYVGTLDVDAVLDPVVVVEPVYRRISELLVERGYRQDHRNRYRWFRTLVIGDQTIEVEVDLLAPSDGSGRRHVRLGGERIARNSEGAAIVREQYELHDVTGTLPDGRSNTVEVRVAGPAALVVLKALALDGRDKPKDAYDIDYVLAHTTGGVDAVGATLRSWSEIAVVQKAVAVLRNKYTDVDANGPASVVLYRRLPVGEVADQTRALAFARVQRVLEIFGQT
jgi:hypothetical protein